MKDPVPFPLAGLRASSVEYPVDVLGRIGAETAKALHQQVQAPLALCGQAVLAAMSTSVSSFGRVQSIMGGETYPISLYLLSIAFKGERKSRLEEFTLDGVEDFQEERTVALMEQQKVGKGTPLSGRSSAIVAKRTDFESLLATMAQGPGSTLWTNDNAIDCFGRYIQSNEEQQAIVAALIRLHRGKAVSLVSSDKCLRVSGVPLTASLRLEPDLLYDVYSDSEFLPLELIDRFLPCFPRTAISMRVIKEDETLDENSHIKDFKDKITKNLWRNLSLYMGKEENVLKISLEAKSVFANFYNKIEEELARGGIYEQISSFADRSLEHAIRISAVIELFNCDHGKMSSISVESAKSGCRFADYYLGEYLTIVNYRYAFLKSSELNALGNWMVEKHGPHGSWSVNEIAQSGPQGIRGNTKKRDELLSWMDEHHWIKLEETGNGRRKSKVYRINPKIENVLH
ncbi:DUF3987 domain-containing protein [Cohaesibacter sp. CAU 1516]|uniref:DUF3987 domain-containing protein n=1 Tax=Cohaesibacter sp. CAU 1516 TaxID=2576038 RepID=UPI001485A116|nr:DUF3987 domain-containing protein [Cohaesibacter sp. CAU 1516]